MWAWFLSPIGRKVGLGIAAAVALFIAVKWYEGKVREDERTKQADKQTQEIEKMREADRAATEKILQDAQARQEDAERRMQASLDREAGLVRTIASLGQQRSAANSDVQRLSESALHGYNIEHLAIRPTGDNSPCYLPTEERAIATAVTQYPLCQKQVETQTAQVAEIKELVSAQNAKIDAMETKFIALEGYTGRLENFYTILYNSIPRKRRGWKCLGLWACSKAKPLPVPAPLELKKP